MTSVSFDKLANEDGTILSSTLGCEKSCSSCLLFKTPSNVKVYKCESSQFSSPVLIFILVLAASLFVVLIAILTVLFIKRNWRKIKKFIKKKKTKQKTVNIADLRSVSPDIRIENDINIIDSENNEFVLDGNLKDKKHTNKSIKTKKDKLKLYKSKKSMIKVNKVENNNLSKDNFATLDKIKPKILSSHNNSSSKQTPSITINNENFFSEKNLKLEIPSSITNSNINSLNNTKIISRNSNKRNRYRNILNKSKNTQSKFDSQRNSSNNSKKSSSDKLYVINNS